MMADEREVRRNNRVTALVLWSIVAFFFFAVIAKYLWLVP